MARPTARVLQLLEVLQSGGTHPVRDLAAHLEVDDRTVRRYVDHLVELGVPVEGVRGRFGGYRLLPGFRLPPLMLTDEEAVAVLVGLALLRGSGLDGDDAAPRAEAKLRRVLPTAVAARLDALQRSLRLSPAAPEGAPAASANLLTLAEAASERRLVGFAYRSAGGRESARVLAPYGIVLHRGHWLVVGLDRDAAEMRTFRVDRMVLLHRLDRSFEEPEGLDQVEEVLTGIASARRRHRVVVRAETSLDSARAILPATLAVVTEDEPGWVRAVVHAESLEWVPALLARLGCRFVVEEPAELVAQVRALGRLLTESADGER